MEMLSNISVNTENVHATYYIADKISISSGVIIMQIVLLKH